MDHKLVIVALIVYLIGSIPFAFILTKIFGHGDIRTIGSGNIGTTNVLRTGNKLLTVFVLIFDILKGYLPTLFILNYFFYINTYEITNYVLGSIAILGHLFPCWLKFKGGKGVATYIGFLFAVNYILGLFFVFLWLFIAFLKKYSSISSIISLIFIPILMLFLSYKPGICLFFAILSIILIIKHYPNIRRLLNKSEPKIKI